MSNKECPMSKEAAAAYYFYIGSSYKDMGQPENSVEWFEKAYAVEPSLRK